MNISLGIYWTLSCIVHRVCTVLIMFSLASRSSRLDSIAARPRQKWRCFVMSSVDDIHSREPQTTAVLFIIIGSRAHKYLLIAGCCRSSVRSLGTSRKPLGDFI